MTTTAPEIACRIDDANSARIGQQRATNAIEAFLAEASAEDILEVFDRLPPTAWQADRQAGCLAWLHALIESQRRHGRSLDTALRQRILQTFEWVAESSICRPMLLQWLAIAGSPDDLHCFARLILASPPVDDRFIALAMSPLFQTSSIDADALFPRLLEGLAHPQLAAPILDLANHLARRQLVTTHPAVGRLDKLQSLAGSLVQQLLRVGESTTEPDGSVRATDEKIDRSVALLICLCDAFALIGDHQVIAKLNQVLELPHRRLRAEAASALARLGDEHGKSELLRLAAEPVVRLRVLADAESLGLIGEVDPQWQTEIARLEAHVALCLAQPACFGMAPSTIDLLDSQTLYWPGFEQPVLCYLFRYGYQLGPSEYRNVAVAGPVVHAMSCDLTELTTADVYAVYAGWDAEHAEMIELEPEQWEDAHRADVQRLQRRLGDDGYESIEPELWGSFFGQPVLIARARHDQRFGLAVIDEDRVLWVPLTASRNPLGPHDAWCLYKGQRLLASFNH